MHLASSPLCRTDLGSLLNEKNLLGPGAEIGVNQANFSQAILDQWKGHEMIFTLLHPLIILGEKNHPRVNPLFNSTTTTHHTFVG